MFVVACFSLGAAFLSSACLLAAFYVFLSLLSCPLNGASICAYSCTPVDGITNFERCFCLSVDVSVGVGIGVGVGVGVGVDVDVAHVPLSLSHCFPLWDCAGCGHCCARRHCLPN